MPSANFTIIVKDVSIDTGIRDKWQSDLLYKRELIYKRLYGKIDTPEKYKELIAYMSYAKWHSFVNPNFPRVEYIKLKQYVKVYGGVRFWHYRTYYAFQPGGAFETGVVQNAQKFFENALEVLRINRARYLNWGPAPIVALILTGDVRGTFYLRKLQNEWGTDYVSITADDAALYFDPNHVTVVRPQIIDYITAGIILSTYAHNAGLTTIRDDVLDKYDALLNDLASKMKASGASITFDMYWDTTKDRPAIRVVASV